MRIIAGNLKGRKLVFPENKTTRPTADMVKEAIFAKLFDKVQNAVFLDAFAGSGQIGIEAISRGAKEVVFIEEFFAAVKAIKQNLQALNIEEKSKVIATPVLKALAKLNKKFDIIFLDPPYDYKDYNQFFKAVKENNLLEEDGLVVCEHARDLNLDFEGFEKVSVKAYGIKCVSYFEII